MKKMKQFVSLMLTSAMAAGMMSASVFAADAFYIGASGPLTGPAANYGTAVVNAAQIAVDEINEAGGINGYQIEYKGEDDELDSEKSVNAYNALKDWGMQILLGPTTTGCAIAVAEKTKADNMFQLTPSGSGEDVTKNDNVFRVCFSDPSQGMRSAQYIGEHQLATKVGSIYDSSDAYSAGIEASFEAAAPDYGIDVAVKCAFTADSNTDFSSQLQQCADAGVELIFLPIYYTQAGTILTQARMMGLDVKFFGCDGLDGMLDMDNFEKSLAEGVMLLTPFAADADDELTKNFVAKYQEAYGMTPNQFAADAYDGVYAIKAALEKAEATPDMEISDLCEALKTAITEIEIAGLTGEKIVWTADGEPNKDPKAVVIQDGAYVSMQ